MVQLLINGLAMGSIYSLVSFGFVLVYNAVGAVNFAHGELVMLGGYLSVASAVILKLPLPLSFLIGLGAMALVGIGFQRLGYYPMRDKPVITVIIASIGMSIALRNTALVIWGPYPLPLSSFFGARMLRWGENLISADHIFIIGVTVALFLLQHLFFNRTYLGKKLEATAQDKEIARLMGINVHRMIVLTFVLSALLSAIAGFLVAPIFFISPEVGLFIILKAFIVIVIGGFGSIPGTLAGGLFLGVTEILLASYISSIYKDAFSFLLLILVLIVMPQGFFGEKVAEKV